MDIILYVDNREMALKPHLTAEFDKVPLFCLSNPIVEYKTLDIADYIIAAKKEDGQEDILAIIERKSLDDYGASIKDGRIMNVEKLLKLRTDTNCQIYYLIEGAANPGYDTLYAGIEYYKILANIRDTQILHGINLINTTNKLNTAKELRFLAERYVKSYDIISSKITGSGTLSEIMQKCKPTEKQQLKTDLLVTWTNLLSSAKDVKTQINPSLKASTLARKWTLKHWIYGRIPEAEVAELRVNNRRLDGAQIEALSQPMSKELQFKLLSCIRGISADMARQVLDIMTLDSILRDPQNANISVVIKGKNRKLGPANYSKIISLTNAKIR